MNWSRCDPTQNRQPRALALCALLGVAACGDDTDAVPRISVQELHASLLDQRAVAVDVRGVDAFRQAHIAGALSLPLDEVERYGPELPTGPRIVTYCS